MRITSVAVVVFLALVGCGGGVDEAFGGTWAGTATLSTPGEAPRSSSATITLRVVDGALHVPGCTASSPPIVVEGSGRSVEWQGRHTCPLPTQSCPTATITTTRYTASLLSDNQIATTGDSVAEGCGATLRVFGSFSGTRQ